MVNPGAKSDDACENKSDRLSKTSDVLHFIRLLTETSTGREGASLGGSARDEASSTFFLFFVHIFNWIFI